MKKILSLILLVTMILSLVACGNSDDKAEKYCWNCGEGISKAASFCDHCGTAVKDINTESENNSTNTTSNNDVSSDNTISSEPTTSSTPTASSEPTTTASSTPTPTTPTHTHSYSKNVTPATCTKQGYTTYTCSCGDTYKDNYTNPSHSYSKYKCTSCGMVDKSHAYEYLVEWVKENGTVDGSYIAYIYSNGGEIYKLGYDAQYDYIYVSKSYVYDGDFVYSNLSLDSYSYLVALGELELFGYLSASSFTSTSPITWVEYEGDPSLKYDFVEYSRLALGQLVEWLDWLLETRNIGISISDLGFTSFQ